MDRRMIARWAEVAAHHERQEKDWLAWIEQREQDADRRKAAVADLANPEDVLLAETLQQSDMAYVASCRGMAGYHRQISRRYRGMIDDRRRVDREFVLDEAFGLSPTFLHVLTGPQFVFEFVNDAYCHLVGRRDLVGRPAFEAMPEAAQGGFPALIARVLKTGEPFVGREIPVVLARMPDVEPEVRLIDLVYSPLVDRDGRCTRVVGHGLDITDLVRHRGTNGSPVQRG